MLSNFSIVKHSFFSNSCLFKSSCIKLNFDRFIEEYLFFCSSFSLYLVFFLSFYGFFYVSCFILAVEPYKSNISHCYFAKKISKKFITLISALLVKPEINLY